MIDLLMEPVTCADWGISNWFGRAVLTTRVEWIGGVTDAADRPHPTDFGPTAAARPETVVPNIALASFAFLSPREPY
jgi:hypothetical protein